MLNMKESQNIERKESWRDECLKWICGFANAEGGKLIIGRDDQGELVGIANAFFRTGMIEAWGQGIERILGTCRLAGVPLPEFQADGSGLSVIFQYVNYTIYLKL